MSKDNQGAIFIADFAGKCIREKVMLTKPQDSAEYYSALSYQEELEADEKLIKYYDHVNSRRTFPYDVKEEQDGKELREGVDFRFACKRCEGEESIYHNEENIAIPIEPDTPLQPVKDQGNLIEAGKILYPLELSMVILEFIAWLESMIPNVKKSLRPQIIEKIKKLGEYKFAPLEPSSKEEYELLKKEYETFHNWVANNMVIKGFGEVEPDNKEQEGDAVVFPDDLDKCLQWGEDNDWVFHQGQWKQDGWGSRTTEQLYQLYKNKP